jgi:hypothetical protein
LTCDVCVSLWACLSHAMCDRVLQGNHQGRATTPHRARERAVDFIAGVQPGRPRGPATRPFAGVVQQPPSSSDLMRGLSLMWLRRGCGWQCNASSPQGAMMMHEVMLGRPTSVLTICLKATDEPFMGYLQVRTGSACPPAAIISRAHFALRRPGLPALSFVPNGADRRYADPLVDPHFGRPARGAQLVPQLL